jgi:uncharacterized protein (DUF362 family)
MNVAFPVPSYQTPIPDTLWGDFPEVSGKRVFIKPNWVQPPLRWDVASCTHVSIIKAVILQCLERGAKGVAVGECGFKGTWEETLLAGGYDTLGRIDPRVELIPLQDGPNFHKFTLVRLDEGRYLSLFGAKFSDYLLECDCIINLPKLKVHSRALVTGAIKNMMGAMTQKGSMHPGDSIDILHKRLRDLWLLITTKLPPMWTLVDGIVGSGYAEQQGVPMNSQLLFSGLDPWGLDCFAASAMGICPEDVPYLKLIHDHLERTDYPKSAWVVAGVDVIQFYDLPFLWK